MYIVVYNQVIGRTSREGRVRRRPRLPEPESHPRGVAQDRHRRGQIRDQAQPMRSQPHARLHRGAHQETSLQSELSESDGIALKSS